MITVLSFHAVAAPLEQRTLSAPSKQESSTLGCGWLGAKHKTTVHETTGQPAEPSPGKALIYFIRSRSLRGALTEAKLAANERWIGVLPRGYYYAVAEIEPGIVNLCATWSISPPRSDGSATLTAEAGKRYYFEARLVNGFRTGVQLIELDEARGASLLAESRLVTFEAN